MKQTTLDDFRAALRAYYLSHKPEPLPEVQCDLLITDSALLSLENVRALDLLEPYGNANPHPVLCMSGVRLEMLSEVGGGKHSRLRVRLGQSHFECIYFSHSAAETGVRESDLIDIAFTPQINEYRGNVTVQLVASAVRPHEPYALCDAILADDRGCLRAAAPYCPERADFVRVWKGMGPAFTVGCDTGAVIRQCPGEMEPEKYCLCLMVLRETGLLKGPGGGIYGAAKARIAGKADLDATTLIRSLHSISI